MKLTKKRIVVLKGKRLIRFLRYGVPQIFYFGTDSPVYEFSLDTNCAWRLLDRKGKVVVGSEDVWIPTIPNKKHDLEKETLRDTLLNKIQKKHCGKGDLTVTSVSHDENSGDLILKFKTGHKLQIFVDRTKEQRIFLGKRPTD